MGEIEDALRLVKATVAGLPSPEIPAARLLHIAELEKKRARYREELDSRQAAATVAETPREIFGHERIVRLHGAALSARLMDSRDALLAGLPPPIIAALSHAGSAADQLLRDLDALNTMGNLVNGANPIVTWLRNAMALTKLRHEGEVFRAALEQALRHRDSLRV